MHLSQAFKGQIVGLPQEETSFDTTIALGQFLSVNELPYVGFGADTGPTNVFTRSLSLNAQRRFAFIIPNPHEHDMRMEGDGESYSQMISNCRVYKCQSLDKQSDTIVSAFEDIINNKK